MERKMECILASISIRCVHTTNGREMNGETISQWAGNAPRLAWCYTRRPKFGQKELHGFIASDSILLQELTDMSKRVNYTRLGIEDVA